MVDYILYFYRFFLGISFIFTDSRASALKKDRAVAVLALFAPVYVHNLLDVSRRVLVIKKKVTTEMADMTEIMKVFNNMSHIVCCIFCWILNTHTNTHSTWWYIYLYISSQILRYVDDLAVHGSNQNYYVGLAMTLIRSREIGQQVNADTS